MIFRKITVILCAIPLCLSQIGQANEHMALVSLAATIEDIALLSTETADPVVIPKQVETPAKQVSRDFTEVAKKCIPSAVSIKVQQKSKSPLLNSEQALGGADPFFNDDFFQRFFGFSLPDQSQNGPVVGQASGFIISPDGYILTNNHVVKDASNVVVTLNDGREFEAKVIGGDNNTDISVIKISASDLPSLKLGNSDNLEVGQWVIAIGTPFGLQASLTVGVVSAKGRSNLDIARVEDFIQTDAAINRGNSGGPLLNIDGEVIGMNTAIASNTGGYMGIGFAIPSNMVKRITDQLIQTGSVVRGYLGIALQKIDQDLAQALNLERIQGVLITEVEKDSPAEAAGLKQGDVVLKYNNVLIDNMGNFRNFIALTAPGTKLDLMVQRGNKTLEIPVTVGNFPDGKEVASEMTDLLGITVQELTPDIAQTLGYQEEHGILVTQVDPKSISALAGIKKGSLIIAVNQQKVSTIDEFNAALKKTEKDKPVLLLIKQGNVIRFVSLRTE